MSMSTSRPELAGATKKKNASSQQGRPCSMLVVEDHVEAAMSRKFASYFEIDSHTGPYDKSLAQPSPKLAESEYLDNDRPASRCCPRDLTVLLLWLLPRAGCCEDSRTSLSFLPLSSRASTGLISHRRRPTRQSTITIACRRTGPRSLRCQSALRH